MRAKWVQTRGIGCALLLGFSPVLQAAQGDDAFDCVMLPSQQVELGSPVPGQLDTVLVDRGDRVRVGQEVARLESTLEQANLDIARFRADTDTELRLRDAALKIDQRTEQRLDSLVSSKLASAHERDRAAREARLSAWRVKQAQDDIDLSALELSRAETVLARRSLRSPIDGVVLSRLHDPGEYIEDQAVLKIISLDPLHVEAIVPMRLFGQVKSGMRARVVAELDDGVAYAAEVDRVDPMGDAGSGTFGVRLVLPNPEQKIPAGLKCRTSFDFSPAVVDRELVQSKEQLVGLGRD
ncbi:MAG: efflux RND transporter periplasmic adaptor subunit [Gammaproteobacteria bacterium]|nr:efflux RND transporter periplasmic adaptor subunit [Gammaproteobacteria bacterium]